MPENELQWKVWIVPDFNEKQSIMIWKSHHVIGDGIGVLLLLSTLQDEYKPTQWIQTSTVMPTFMKVMLTLMKPFTLTYAFLWFFFWSTDQNCIKTPQMKLAGKKRNAICKPFSIQTLKKIGQKYNKSTINDVILAMSSVAVKEYMVNHGDSKSKSINILIPYSLREIPKTPQEHRLCNDFSCLCFTLDICENFE